MKKNKILLIITFLIVLLTFTGCNESKKTDTKKIDKFKEKINVNIDINNYGTISLELYPNIAPETVNNFVNLVKNNFYDGLTFHRIMDKFMIQGGDPNANGTGGSGITINGEFEANGFKNELKHERGVISMARGAYDYNSASSQFFIVQTTYPSLDGLYASFGRVTSGMEIVDEICKNTPVEDDNGTVLKENQPIINKIYIVE
ncbi:MAG: peptidylprolyl isomerase [Bacilli bacterium]|nr:peptidylprolyl isomerase [Bacilli bacterium]